MKPYTCLSWLVYWFGDKWWTHVCSKDWMGDWVHDVYLYAMDWSGRLQGDDPKGPWHPWLPHSFYDDDDDDLPMSMRSS